MSIVCLLLVFAFIATLGSALGKVPVWIPVLILTIAGLLNCLPLR
jgi:hypothetical protein